MVTVYHTLDADALLGEIAQPRPESLELVALVTGTDDPAEAFDHVIHRDGENWTADPAVLSFGDRRNRRSSHEGDVFVTEDGMAHMVLPIGFQRLEDLRLPFLAGDGK